MSVLRPTFLGRGLVQLVRRAMKWSARNDDGWRRRFAILPVKIGNDWLWLEWFERRFAGEYYEVRHENAE